MHTAQDGDDAPPVELQSASNVTGDERASIPRTIECGNEVASIIGPTTTTVRPLDAVYDCFEFEWFWILIYSILLFASEIAFQLIIRDTDFINFAGGKIKVLGIMIGSICLYASIFVMLMEYHQRIGQHIEYFLHISRKVQMKWLRAYAYIHLLWMLVFGIMLIWTFEI